MEYIFTAWGRHNHNPNLFLVGMSHTKSLRLTCSWKQSLHDSNSSLLVSHWESTGNSMSHLSLQLSTTVWEMSAKGYLVMAEQLD